MNGRIDWDIVTLGRTIGVAVILLGIGLSAWDVFDFPAGVSSWGTGYKVRFFLEGALRWVASGGLLILAAEIADRLGWGRGGEPETPGDDVPSMPPGAALG